jgi:octaprenyl-diphosphate synthase
MGDWLYMSAFETSLAERSLEILDILTAVTRKMTEGELLQLTQVGELAISQEQYLDIVQRKTAFLFSACCEIGAMLGGATVSQRKALRDYGLNLGMAFQLTDDLLDFTSSEVEMGKAAGADLLGGKITLPLIYLLENDSSSRDQLEKVMRARCYDGFSRTDLLSALENRGCLQRARQRAGAFAEAARADLAAFPDSEHVAALRAIPSYVTHRDY